MTSEKARAVFDAMQDYLRITLFSDSGVAIAAAPLGPVMTCPDRLENVSEIAFTPFRGGTVDRFVISRGEHDLYNGTMRLPTYVNIGDDVKILPGALSITKE